MERGGLRVVLALLVAHQLLLPVLQELVLAGDHGLGRLVALHAGVPQSLLHQH
jgi:hypothetical protein